MKTTIELEKATKVACLEAQLSSIWYDHTRAGGQSVHGWRNATYVNGVSSETPEWRPFRTLPPDKGMEFQVVVYT